MQHRRRLHLRIFPKLPICLIEICGEGSFEQQQHFRPYPEIFDVNIFLFFLRFLMVHYYYFTYIPWFQDRCLEGSAVREGKFPWSKFLRKFVHFIQIRSSFNFSLATRKEDDALKYITWYEVRYPEVLFDTLDLKKVDTPYLGTTPFEMIFIYLALLVGQFVSRQ